jgi:hypothetical protein
MKTKTALLLIGLAAMAAYATPSFSQQAQPQSEQLQEGNVYLFTPDGRMVSKPIDMQKHPEAARAFKPAGAGMLAFAHDGKLYIASDKSMKKGGSLTKVLFGGNCIVSPGSQGYQPCDNQ